LDKRAKIDGSPSPLGVSRVERERAYNFALNSKHATGVILLLYSDRDLVNPIYQYSSDSIIRKERYSFSTSERSIIWSTSEDSISR
jgi:hypothetical protein